MINGILDSNQKIVSNGLVLNLDAAQLRSYPGSGTTWTDLSGNAYNGTLTNGPTFDSENGGSIVFDGTNDYVNLPSSGFFLASTNNFFASAGYAWTVSAWFKFPVSPGGTRTGNTSWSIFGKAGGIGGSETITLYIGSATDTTYSPSVPYYCIVGIRGSKTVISPSSVNTNTWNNVVVTWNGSAGRVYFNGTDRGAANIGSAAIQTGQYAGIGVTGYNGTTLLNPPQHFQGNISSVQIYNRGISSTEVTQNYNAIKSRFGL